MYTIYNKTLRTNEAFRNYTKLISICNGVLTVRATVCKDSGSWAVLVI